MMDRFLWIFCLVDCKPKQNLDRIAKESKLALAEAEGKIKVLSFHPVGSDYDVVSDSVHKAGPLC